MDENDPNVTVCHMRLGGNGAKLIVDIAREKAYYSGVYNDGIAFLFGCGIEDYDVCEKILKGKLTLESEDDEDGHEVLVTVNDDWQPPEKETDTLKMKQEVEKYCREMLSYRYSGHASWRIMHSEREIAYIEGKLGLFLDMVQYNPKKAYDEMKIFSEELIDETHERALERSGYIGRKREEGIEKEEKRTKRAEIVEEAKQLIDVHKAKKKRIESRAKRHLDPCGDDECRYCQKNMCCLGGRNTKGCIQAEPDLAMQVEASVIVASRMDDPAEMRKIMSKQYVFMFKGHEYTFSDSARNQGRCPECDKESISGRMIELIEDDEAGTFTFIGIKQLSESEYAVCYECLDCFTKFYYHAYTELINTWLELHPELEDKIDRLVKYDE